MLLSGSVFSDFSIVSSESQSSNTTGPGDSDFTLSFTREAFPEAVHPALTLFLLQAEQLQLFRVEPNAVAFVAAVDLHIFKSDFDKRAVTFRAADCGGFCLLSFLLFSPLRA